MAGIVDGQSVNAAQSNAAWLAKNGDDQTTGQLGLANPTTATHGTAIVSSQKQFNSFASALGLAVNQAYNYAVAWASDAIGSANQTFKARIESVVSFLIANTVVLPGTGAIQIPKGDTAERPSPVTGMLRYNDQEDEFEGYAAGAWGPIGGGGGERASSSFTGTAVTPTAGIFDETFLYAGSSVQAFTGFGALSGLSDGYRATIMGSSDTNTLTIAHTDSTDGYLLNGDAELGRGQCIMFEYNSTLARMVEITRNF